MRKNILIANWKMNLLRQDSVRLATALKEHCSNGLSGTEVWLAPSFSAISALSEITSGSSLRLGAQNVHWEPEGAWTGEVSAAMLKELDCSFAIVGHSERRHSFKEDAEMVAKRALGAIKNGLIAVFCVGETIEERESGKTFDTITRQLAPLQEIREINYRDRLLLAYEPVWAIGTGKNAEPSQILEAHSFIMDELKNLGLNSPGVLYGGSVKPENFADTLKIENVSGALIGGASLKSESLCKMIDISETIQSGS